MKKDEYNSLIEQILKNRDDIDAFDTLKNELEKDITTLESYESENKKLKDKVDELRDVNIRLFLKQPSTGAEHKEEPEEKTDEDIFNELFANKIKGD